MSEHTNVATGGLDDAGTPNRVEDDLPSLLRRRELARPNRATWILLALLLASVGFLSGAYVHERFGAPASIMQGGFPALRQGGAGPEQGNPLAVGDTTVGTVKLVDKQSLYITTPTGETVKVSVPDTATVTAEQDVDLADLETGSTVLIRGTTGPDGTVIATSVSEGSPAGVMPGGTTPRDSRALRSTPTTQGEN